MLLMQIHKHRNWVETVKKTESPHPVSEQVFFDEFAVYDRPSLFYGWGAGTPSRSQE